MSSVMFRGTLLIARQEECDAITGAVEVVQHVEKSLVRDMRNIHHHAQPVHLAHHLFSEIREPVVLRRLARAVGPGRVLVWVRVRYRAPIAKNVRRIERSESIACRLLRPSGRRCARVSSPRGFRPLSSPFPGRRGASPSPAARRRSAGGPAGSIRWACSGRCRSRWRKRSRRCALPHPRDVHLAVCVLLGEVVALVQIICVVSSCRSTITARSSSRATAPGPPWSGPRRPARLPAAAQACTWPTSYNRVCGSQWLS